jgi:phage protein D
VLVFAEDGLQRLRMMRRTRTFADSTTADIARRICSDHSLTPAVELDGPSRTVTAQLNQSDLAFLRALVRRDDGEVWLDGTTLHVARRPDREATRVQLRYGVGLASFSVRADLADQCTEVAVTGWDVAGKQAIDERAGRATISGELGSGQVPGAEVLARAFAARTETVVTTAPLVTGDAQALAGAAYRERARRFLCGTGHTAGTAVMRVGSPVELAGLGGLFDGVYTVTRTRHLFDLALGLRTEFDVERPGLGRAS